jgi:hypothetical protein
MAPVQAMQEATRLSQEVHLQKAPVVRSLFLVVCLQLALVVKSRSQLELLLLVALLNFHQALAPQALAASSSLLLGPVLR